MRKKSFKRKKVNGTDLSPPAPKPVEEGPEVVADKYPPLSKKEERLIRQRYSVYQNPFIDPDFATTVKRLLATLDSERK